MVENSFPSLDECKLVLYDKYAVKYFGWLNEIKSNYFNSNKPRDFLTDFGMIRYIYKEEDERGINNGVTVFNNVGSENILTNDFSEDWKKFYRPNLKVYQIIYFTEPNKSEGFRYDFFISIDGSWKYFLKPKRSIFSEM